jgi:transketolase
MNSIKSTREAFIAALTDLSAADSRHVLVSADSLKAARATPFYERWPERVIETGIAEQGALDVAAGAAALGLIPYVTTYAGFITMRACEQMRTFIAYPNLPVRLVGLNGGLLGGEREGVTHQFYEDLAITRAIPGMTVLSPADADAVYHATIASATIPGPLYLRLGSGREPVARVPVNAGYDPARIRLVADKGQDIAIFSTGFILNRVLDAADQLAEQGIGCQVYDVAMIKPLDQAGVLQALRQVRAIITVEDHQINGGLGSALAEFAGEHCPLPIRRIGLKDTFGRSGMPDELLDRYGISAAGILAAAHELLE